jgi:[protein-PII] uridylyltransferase
MTAIGPTTMPARRPAAVRAAVAVAALRERLAAERAAGMSGLAFGRLATDLCDAVVRGVWDDMLAELPATQAAAVARHAALVAHGGFGRREMAPFSDIDLMILHDGAAAAAVADVARFLLQDLFDAGLQVGQSVRTIAEACRLSGGDATILSSLLECRALAGNGELVSRLATRLAALVRRAPRRHAGHLLDARAAEADKHGRTVCLLEPDVKRSRGGLRDLQLVGWLGALLHGTASRADLVGHGALTAADATALDAAHEFLAAVRIDLHLAAGKAADVLVRDEQARLAAARGIGAEGGLLGVERFMRDYFGHATRVAAVVEQLVAAVRPPPRLARLAAGVLGHPVDGLYRVGPADVGALPGRLPAITASLPGILRLVEVALIAGLPVEREAWDAIRVAAPAFAGGLDAESSAAFLRLFAHPAHLADALRRLHETGILEILVPEFEHARHLLQFNNYHKYTVDEHCILAVERATEFTADDGWLGGEWRALSRKRPLLLALLVHDLGKGFVDDHSEVGARIARDVAVRLGLPADEAEIVEFLVHKHLAMAHLAFRRDVDDDSLIVRFARDVGSPEVLRMLALLTAADIAAVGPGTWTRWKADLLGDLHFRTLAQLDGDLPTAGADRERRAVEALLAERGADERLLALVRRLPAAALRHVTPERVAEEVARLARLPGAGIFTAARWQPETGTVVVTVGTREEVATGIFHRVAGAITALRLEVLAADINTLDDGLVIDHFVVHDPDFAGAPPAERLAEIAAAIRAALQADTAPEFARRWNPFAPREAPAARLPARVSFDNESSADATIIEVFAHDEPGLLYEVARAIFAAGLSVRAAKIGTHLDQVVDAFHVTADGGKLTDADRLAALRHALERAVEPVAAPR